MNPEADAVVVRSSDPVRAVTAFTVTDAGPDSSLSELAESMRAINCGALFVWRPSDSVPSIVSERDIVRALADGGDPTAGGIARPFPVTVDADAPIAEAASLMATAGVRHLLVQDGDRWGIVSVRDVLEPLVDSLE